MLPYSPLALSPQTPCFAGGHVWVGRRTYASEACRRPKLFRAKPRSELSCYPPSREPRCLGLKLAPRRDLSPTLPHPTVSPSVHRRVAVAACEQFLPCAPLSHAPHTHMVRLALALRPGHPPVWCRGLVTGSTNRVPGWQAGAIPAQHSTAQHSTICLS